MSTEYYKQKFVFFDRLREERLKLGLNQSKFGAVGGVSTVTQGNYESGKRNPDLAYLASIAAIGADVQYIITGERKTPDASALAPDAIEIIKRYDVLSDEDKGHIRGILASLVKANGNE